MRSWRDTNLLNFEELNIPHSSISNALKEKLLLNQEEIPDDIKSWLGRLELLYGIPFSILVPHADILPVESIRFFQIDENWLYSLIEGVLSLGRVSESDKLHDNFFREKIHLKTSQLRKFFRKGGKLPHKAISESNINEIPMTGFLLRSELVEGWPGLEVKAYSKEKVQLPLLRFDRLSSNVLICLFEGIIHEIILQEPPESLHFGLDFEDSSTTSFSKDLKYLRSQGGKQAGEAIENASVKSVPFRNENDRVIDITALAENLRGALIQVNAWDKNLAFTSAEFALQMVEGVQKASFLQVPEKEEK